MILDLSAYNVVNDWKKVATSGVTGVILRATTKNGKIDSRFVSHLNGFLQNCNETMNEISIYKFSYERTYITAYIECCKTLATIQEVANLNTFDYLFLDLEAFSGRDYTTAECNEVIKGYLDGCAVFGVKLGLYFNYNYAKNIVDNYWSYLPLWLARYNKTMGDVTPFKPIMWQYTSTGTVDGITGNVDISKRLNNEN